jgi:multiple sugar transport system permease protein
MTLSYPARRRLQRTLFHAIILLFVAFLLLPVYQMLVTAVKPATQAWDIPPTLLPHEFTFSHFTSMWDIVPRLPIYLGNSLLYGIGVSAISLFVGIPSAYGLTRYRMRIKTPLLMALIYGNMFAPIMLLVPLQEIMSLVGLTNTYLGMIIAGSIFTTPFSTWLFVSYFQTIPTELDESGLVDGASRLTILLRIVMPLLAPAIVAVAIYAFITGWSQQFQLALVLVQDNLLMPVTQGLYQFFARSSVRWTELMAAALVTSLIPFVLFFSVQRYLVKGMTAGAVKE